jgi:hypothetical protein
MTCDFILSAGGDRVGAKDLARRFSTVAIAGRSFAVSALAGAIAARSFAVCAAQDKVTDKVVTPR